MWPQPDPCSWVWLLWCFSLQVAIDFYSLASCLRESGPGRQISVFLLRCTLMHFTPGTYRHSIGDVPDLLTLKRPFGASDERSRFIECDKCGRSGPIPVSIAWSSVTASTPSCSSGLPGGRILRPNEMAFVHRSQSVEHSARNFPACYCPAFLDSAGCASGFRGWRSHRLTWRADALGGQNSGYPC
jgi:hypothetical protein